MGVEIERKYLVTGEEWRSLAQGVGYRQGYITATPEKTVRIRVAGDRAYITIKGKTQGIARAEYEYAIPRTDAEILLDTLCDRPFIEKVRYRIEYGDLIWEVDEFLGENQGLIMAEVELPDEHHAIDLPPWVGKDVSGDVRYYNSNLAKQPYRWWSEPE